MVSDRHRFEETFWRRHSDPKSGWSRTVVLPALLYAIYHREWKLAAAAVVFTILNPLLFSPPETDNAWMTRVVLAERWWSDRDRGVIGVEYPNVLNTVNIPVTLYAIIAAYRQQPRRTALAGAGAMLLKFWYVGELVREYDSEIDR